jgi:LemA protein
MLNLLIISAIPIILLLIFVSFYNRIVSLENRIANAFAQIDVQLKQRNDLIPNLVNTVKGYAAHESGIFGAVSEARARMAGAGSMEDKIAASNNVSGALGRLFAVAENYPDLKANQNFLDLQQNLQGLEQKIAYSRQFFNDTVLEFNTAITTIPGSFFAGPMGKTVKPMFQATEAERVVPQVQF